MSARLPNTVSIGALAGVLALTAAAATATAVEIPRFVEETATSGVAHQYVGGWEFFVGGGVAVFDCNGDGRPDLYIAGGAGASVLYRNESAVGGALRFAPVPDGGADLSDALGAYPLNVDGDAFTDLIVLRLGENIALRGLGDCRFERANEAWGFEGGAAWSTSFSARWEGGRAWPTLAIGNYVDREAPGSPWGTCADNVLHRPAAAGSGFGRPSALSPGYCSLSMLFSDWDRSGRADLRVANDRHYYRGGEEQLWRIPAGEPPELYTRNDGWKKLVVWGMGIAGHDLTGDGFPEYVVTSMGDNKVQSLTSAPQGPAYEDIALSRGMTAHRPFTGGDINPSTGWHAEFQDVNNDGLIDLFIAKGNVEDMPEAAMRDPNNLLMGQPDGTFVEGAEQAGIISYARARGAALADLNLDGMPDLVVVNRHDSVQLWRNVGLGDAANPVPIGNWLALRLRQAGGNRDAIGAWIEVKAGGRTQRREITVGGGHAGGTLGWVHLGLGAEASAVVRVEWPGGQRGEWIPIRANRFFVIERERGQARRWIPPM